MITRNRLIAVLVAVGLLLIVIFQMGLYNLSGFSDSSTKQIEPQNPDQVQVLSTNPSPLEDATILPTQEIEITFSDPVLNPDELKHVIEPEVDHKITLSEDRKTAKIVPNTPFLFGQGYTIFIKTDTKFEGDKKLPEDKIYHIKTIDYSGV